MAKMSKTTTLAIFGSLLTPALYAQGSANASQPVYVNQDTFRGQMSAMVVGLSLETNQGTTDRVLAKAEGDQQSFPLVWGPNSPSRAIDYDPAILFPGVSGLVSIDAWSTGNDFVPAINLNGEVVLDGFDSWVAITVSFSQETNGAGGSNPDLVDHRKARAASIPGLRDDPGADLYSYYFPGSKGIASRLIGRTVVEQASEHMGLGSGDQIDAMDFGMGVFSFRGASIPSRPYELRNRLYFSITRASASALDGHYGMPGQTAHFAHTDASSNVFVQNADPAAVYAMDWNETNSSWSTPYVYRSSANLIDRPEAGTFDVDAIAVDHGTNEVIFSTTLSGQVGAPLESQIMVSQPNGLGFTTTPLKDEIGDAVGGKVGSGDETRDVDAICISDPEAFDYMTHMGTNVAHLQPEEGMVREADPLGFGVTRVGPPTPAVGPDPPLESLHLHATGRTALGDPGGIVFFFGAITVNPQLTLPNLLVYPGQWQPIGILPWFPDPATGLKEPSKGLTLPVPNYGFMPSHTIFLSAIYLEAGTNKVATSFISATSL